MKRLLILLCALLILCGCANHDAEPTTPTETVTTPPVSEPSVPSETAPPETQPAETTPTDPASYTRSLHAAVPIFSGPGYDYSYVQTVGEDGTYTIVEETHDTEGNVWGRLKSGAGWIDLTSLEADPGPVTAAYADDALLGGGNYHEFIAEDSEYLVKIVFRAAEPLTDVQFSLLEPDAADFDSYTVYRQLHTLPELTPGKPFVAGVVFYGDLTAYGISFTDQGGTARHYAVTVSGRNGALVLEEYTP